MWVLTEGSVHTLQDCRDGSSPIGSGTTHVFVLHCSFSHVEEVVVVCARVLWRGSFESTSLSWCTHIVLHMASICLSAKACGYIVSVRFLSWCIQESSVKIYTALSIFLLTLEATYLTFLNLQTPLWQELISVPIGNQLHNHTKLGKMQSSMLLRFAHCCFVLKDGEVKCIRGLTWCEWGLRGAAKRRCCPWTAERTGPLQTPWKTESSTQESFNQINKQWYTKGN